MRTAALILVTILAGACAAPRQGPIVVQCPRATVTSISTFIGNMATCAEQAVGGTWQ